MVDQGAHKGDSRLLTRQAKSLSSCTLAWEVLKAYRALSWATCTVTWSRYRAMSETLAMKGAMYWMTPPRTTMTKNTMVT